MSETGGRFGVLIRAGVLAVTGVLGACTEHYAVAGLFEAGGAPFFGTVNVGMGQSGTIDVATADGRIRCSGASKVTQLPSGFSYIGAQGSATALCNDGGSFKIDFIQTSETGGRGQGIDDRGNIVQIYFDMSDGLARSMLDQHRLNALVQ